MKKAGILGSGVVGKTLAEGLLKYGYEVMISSREPSKLEDWKLAAKAKGPAYTGTFAEAASFGEIIILAVQGEAAITALIMAGAENLEGKTIIDTTNPIDHSRPPVNGVLQYFTKMDESLMEQIQKAFPASNLVKAFNSVGSSFMVNPQFSGGKPSMFICGNNDQAKAHVKAILDVFGWETEDMGKAESARPIEALCVLWCAPGMLRNQWTHAFKLLKI